MITARTAKEPTMITPDAAVAQRAHIVVPSPIGSLTLVAEHGRLTGLYMDTHGRQPGSDVLGGTGDPADQPFAPAVRQLEDYFAGQADSLRPPARAGRHAVPAAGVGRAGNYPLRRDLVVRPACSRDRSRVSKPRGRPGQWQESHRRRHSMSPGHRLGRKPDRLWRRPGSQAVLAQARSRCLARRHPCPIAVGRQVVSVNRIFMQAALRNRLLRANHR